ncbi:MAG: 6-phospho-beta-glucosidase [Cutibacterium granulosum]|uniref:6-phospho-beta-glucosidase n=1 Tax=Cutibacterium granulosum TaxID=33011 RepID=UPI00290B29DD|nr:6-phospho-beta-glucosidase [Cutibacterium granulosum]MDU3822083.1 6-phospho-beta-glucosidase [Cutibacterium granulosum]
MKLTILGGGGFRVPLVFKALARDTSPQRVTELRLHDTDPVRLRVIDVVLAQLAPTLPHPPEVVATTDLPRALEGTDFIFSAIRVAGTHGRALDESLCLARGVIGQETVGAGGIFYALRGIPVVLDLVEQINRHAPNAKVINFTNPAGVMTEVMQRHLGEQVVGICDSPVGLARRILTTLQDAGLVPRDLPSLFSADGRIHVGYSGLNHLGWLTSLEVDGVDVLPRLLGRPDLIEGFEEGRLFGADLVQALGAVPNEYLHYYYFSRDDLAADRDAEAPRGAFLEAQQNRFYARAQHTVDVAELWEATRLEREETYMATNREVSGRFDRDESDLETGGYDEVALAIMHAIANDVPAELILNVANDGALPDLPDEAVVEIPCRVDGSGIHRLSAPALPDHARGLVVNAKYVEQRTIAAVVNRSRTDALLALSHHPLVDSVHVAEQLLDDFTDSFDGMEYLKDDHA